MKTCRDKLNGGAGMKAGRRQRARVAGALLLLPLAACDTSGLVEIDTPDIIGRPIVEDPENIDAVRNGALFEFARAIGGTTSNLFDTGLVAYGGLLADELWASSTYTTTHNRVDGRNVESTNGGANLVFFWLQRARNATELASQLYTQTPQVNSPEHAQMTALSGYSYVFFAESYCSGVPFSRQPFEGATEYGAPQSTEQILTTALARFESAIQQAGTSAQQLNLARIGQARALQGLGRFQEAAQAVAAVPTGYVYNIDHSESSTGQNNGTWYWTNSAARLSAATNEGTNGLNYFNRGPGPNTIDPRVPVDSAGTGLGTNVPQYNQGVYVTRGAPIRLASGIEARLIEAEAALNGGQSPAYLTTLNALRATLTGLAPLVDPGTPQARVRQLYGERARWLWLTGHRLGDLRRMIWHYGFQGDQVFPVGATIQGLSYGDHVNLAIPFSELNNPNFDASQACTDRTR
jgi:starch-binding outer membrane protein, SusD/RagB family